MQKILLTLIILASVLTADAQKARLNSLFDQYEGTKGVTTIKIAKPMFRMLSNLKIDDADVEKIKPLLTKINSIKIMVVEPKAGNSATANTLRQAVDAAIRKMNYQELMTVTSEANKIKFLAENASGNVLDHLLLSIMGESEQVLMLLDGSISMDDISRLANEK